MHTHVSKLHFYFCFLCKYILLLTQVLLANYYLFANYHWQTRFQRNNNQTQNTRNIYNSPNSLCLWNEKNNYYVVGFVCFYWVCRVMEWQKLVQCLLCVWHLQRLHSQWNQVHVEQWCATRRWRLWIMTLAFLWHTTNLARFVSEGLKLWKVGSSLNLCSNNKYMFHFWLECKRKCLNLLCNRKRCAHFELHRLLTLEAKSQIICIA